ncbi:hypothetical protein DFH08DRAFT_947629 [Mycena albidolilacea]|uniref:F-box domain-containing protein n=1 Tax=Mycena albidolilacea TaxID=1033008 RepID=A0AAD7F4V8_9AGAR|nr:hypothetical protein DFH08DRAFT_947629 [Mycena albidolilacea]
MRTGKYIGQDLELSATVSHQAPIRLPSTKPADPITYPILTLPFELTSEIFTHCLPAERFIDVVNPGEAPLLLTRVCQTWRQIAISTPALWAIYDVEDPRSLPCFTEIAQTWFERARECALTVSIRGNLPMNDTLGYFMDTFRRHSLEIRSLELQMDLQDFVEMNSDSLELVEFPMLQKLSITIDEISEVGV